MLRVTIELIALLSQRRKNMPPLRRLMTITNEILMEIPYSASVIIPSQPKIPVRLNENVLLPNPPIFPRTVNKVDRIRTTSIIMLSSAQP